MKIIERLAQYMLSHHGFAREPDQIIGGYSNPYLERWYVIPRNKFFNIYLHCFHRSDDERALHDHPWAWCSILLIGSYVEWSRPKPGDGCPLPFIVRRFKAGSVRFHWPSFAHRLVIDYDTTCWTLFITGPRVRRWGFHCPKGWVFWKDFVDPNDPGAVGPGCGDKA